MEKQKQFLSILLSVTLALLTWPLDACKKSEDKQSQASPQGQAQTQAPAATYAVPTADQLYQLVAPIALFPDNLVAQVLAASTYPDQITAANAWLQQNASLKGDQLMEAADQQPWDASVKALTQFGDVLNQMATSLSWTSALGDAYFNIPQSVMNAVQVMRQRAQQAGNLKSNQQQNVTVQNQAPGEAAAPAASNAPQTVVVQAPPQTIVIQPAQPQVVYVPTYNPTVVYGAPVPVYPGYSSADLAVASVISFGVGIAVGAAIANNNRCCGWGWNSWGCGWHNSTVVYNHNTYISTSNTFVNRNNYYNRNVNVNNINRNNVNVNNVNRNNINSNNYRANNFNNTARNSNLSTPNFGQKYNQPQFNNSNNRGNLGESNRLGGSNQANLNQQNRAGLNQNQNRGGLNQTQNRPNNLSQNRPESPSQNRPNNLSQAQNQSARGYGQQANRGNSNSAFSNYSPGGNARVNSARGQQSLAAKPAPTGGGNRSAGAARPQPHAGGGRRR